MLLRPREAHQFH
jgi:hypothetical protein